MIYLLIIKRNISEVKTQPLGLPKAMTNPIAESWERTDW